MKRVMGFGTTRLALLAFAVAGAMLPPIVTVGATTPTPRPAPAALPPCTTANLGGHQHPITTTNPQAQALFDQGLGWTFAFNYDEALRCFRRGIALDATAPMLHWGVALALGPNINMEIEPAQAKEAHDAITAALALAPGASESERAYITALATRYASDPRANLSKHAIAYKDAMRDLASRYPDDLDAATLYAESLMNLRPWKLWKPDGTPEEGTEEIITILESVLKRAPRHPGANHYYIHAVEASPHPERAFASAQRLETLAPGAPHLVHMPAHVYMRTGDYDGAARSNQAAARADQEYIRRSGVRGMYPLMYYCHNLQFLAAAHAMAGKSKAAAEAAARTHACAAPSLEELPFFEFYLATPVFAALRFQRWQDVLAIPEPAEDFAAARALRHFGRALAHAALGDSAKAQADREAFATLVDELPADTMLNLNRAADVLAVAAAVLRARTAAQGGDRARAIEEWRKAVAAEDALAYDEPPAWYYPVRESLGAALMQDGRVEEAEAVFRADLERTPRNGRSLFGLAESLRAQKKMAAAAWVQREFETAWKSADVRPRLADY